MLQRKPSRDLLEYVILERKVRNLKYLVVTLHVVDARRLDHVVAKRHAVGVALELGSRASFPVMVLAPRLHMEERGACAAAVLDKDVRVVLRRVGAHLEVDHVAAAVHRAATHRHVRRGRTFRSERKGAMRRIAEGAVLDEDICRRTVPRELRVVVRPRTLSAFHNDTVVVYGDIDIAHREATALVDIDGIGRRPFEFLSVRILENVGNDCAVMDEDIFAVVEMGRPELGVLERDARDLDVLRVAHVEDAGTHQILVAEVAAVFPRFRALRPELLPRVRAVSVNRPLARDRKAVAAVGVDERGIVKARLTLDARLAHRVAFGLVNPEDRRALLQAQVDTGLEEECARAVDARRERERSAAIRSERVDACLQRPGGVRTSRKADRA